METRFESSGSLPPPGPIGRSVRLGWGVLIAWGTWSLVAGAGDIAGQGLPPMEWAVPFLLQMWLVPAVVNIGWGVSWGRWPRYAVAAALPASVLASRLLTGATWTPVLGWLWLGVLVYTFGHLGVSFLLAAALGTPGCEMRALPHLWSLVRGREAPEHYCPGHIDAVDAWERRLRGDDRSDEPGRPSPQ